MPHSSLSDPAQRPARSSSSGRVGRVQGMEAWFNATGTYVGAQAQVPPSFGVTLVRADKFSYCLQAGSGANVQHMNGPNENAPIAGPC